MLSSRGSQLLPWLVASITTIFALLVLVDTYSRAEFGSTRRVNGDEGTTVNVRVATFGRIGHQNSTNSHPSGSTPSIEVESNDATRSGMQQSSRNVSDGPSMDFNVVDPGSFLQPDLAFAEYDADDFFEALFKTNQVDPKSNWVVEAGSFNGKQLHHPLQNNFNIMVFEPSSRNFQRMAREVKRTCKRYRLACKGQLKTYQKAASGTRTTVEFLSTKKGGTGDHVALGGRVAQGEYAEQFTRKEVVEAVPLDDYLLPVAERDKIFALKIDVQDHEPAVLRGLSATMARGLVDFILLEYRPQGWAHMFPDSKPETELLRVCGQPHYRCFYTERMTRESLRNAEYPKFFPGWASTGPEGKGWPIASFNKKMAELKQVDDFGTWTDIVAINVNSTLATNVLKEMLRRKCNSTMYTASPPQCRPVPR